MYDDIIGQRLQAARDLIFSKSGDGVGAIITLKEWHRHYKQECLKRRLARASRRRG